MINFSVIVRAVYAHNDSFSSKKELFFTVTTPLSSMKAKRFEEVAKLDSLCFLELHGIISTRLLSLKTHYSAYPVFKIIDGFWLGNYPAQVAVGIGVYSSRKIVCLNLPWMMRTRSFCESLTTKSYDDNFIASLRFSLYCC
ncbi:hypothetical protein L6164_012952 [Bauhinia variegata]|uniref:Uncharacterized protein n=1 Tax=Bauhinia variegata TaxID=167791 RepID=A0ACB9PD51_BAUVA|nr:hypothetical protein L6164_012952 [Bauhinia variegata]